MSGIVGQYGIGQRSGIIGPAASNQPAFSCQGDGGANPSLTTGWTTFTDMTELTDQGGDLASGVFTAPVDGMYQFNVITNFEGISAGNDLRTAFFKNDSTGFADRTMSSQETSTAQCVTCIAALIPLDAGDTIRVKTICNEGSATGTISASDTKFGFSGYLAC
jgi:hypothetical protein